MVRENFRLLAGVIAAHPGRLVNGRTRLQKTIKLLQRLDLPTDYSYTIHFYGPYSEGINADIRLLSTIGLVEETVQPGREGEPRYKITAKPEAVLAELQPFQRHIDRMANAELTVLELAATYDMFRESGADHEEALGRLRRKK